MTEWVKDFKCQIMSAGVRILIEIKLRAFPAPRKLNAKNTQCLFQV
jgi:hypothetical protein